MKKFLLLMLLAPAALSAAADSGADASVVVRKDSAFVEKHRFLPTAKRIDRRIDRNKFAYKGEVALGITADAIRTQFHFIQNDWKTGDVTTS